VSDGSPRRGPSLRIRLVVLSTVGLAIGLAVGGFVLTVVLRAGLERASDDASAQSAREVALLITTDRLPDPIPAGGTTLVQVVDPQGRVVAASAGADALTIPFCALTHGTARRVRAARNKRGRARVRLWGGIADS